MKLMFFVFNLREFTFKLSLSICIPEQRTRLKQIQYFDFPSIIVLTMAS